ncbi:MAG TPA: GTPase ObgE [Candidatus Paceibacterota bacterium]
MALVDTLTIEAYAGRGGDGVVRWLHLKGKEFSGPAGGNGGDGGDVYLRAVPDINRLARYSGEKVFRAGNGVPGEGRNKDGKRGEDYVIEVPRGSIAVNKKTGETYELMESGDTVLVLKGGRGGAGNRVFKSSVNRTPDKAMPGGAGESAEFDIELRLIADVGLIGLPNAGKSTLLNTLTRASAKIGAYAFTTLEPNLGAFFEFVLADIPGLVEDASQGRGLGNKFLRHIARTQLLAHCVSLEEEDPMSNYRTIREELKKWGGDLDRKDEIIILTKSDCRDALKTKDIYDEFTSLGRDVFIVSVIDDESVKKLRDGLVALLRNR